MPDRDKEKKLNALLIDTNGKLNSKLMTQKLKIKGGSLIKDKPQSKTENKSDSPRDERQLTSAPKFFKPTSEMLHNKFQYNGQILREYKDYKPKRKYSTEPLVKMIHKKQDDIYEDASKQYQDGLTAADNGAPSTLNKQLTMMSTKYVKPSVYATFSQNMEFNQPGYKAALMLNMARQREQQERTQNQPNQVSTLEQSANSDELKKRRNQITVDYNYFLKRLGNDTLKDALGDLANDMTLDLYNYIKADVVDNLPVRVDTMPLDMSSMEALITGLNSSNKGIFIMDEIYINAGDYDFAGTDFVYLDLSLMKESLYHILCQVLISIISDRGVLRGQCQVNVKTGIDIGSTEAEFFKIMGYNTFDEIFGDKLQASSIELGLIYDAITGRKQFQSGISTRITTPQESIPTDSLLREDLKKKVDEAKLKQYNETINDLDDRIDQLDNTALVTFRHNENPRPIVEEADKLYAKRVAYARERNNLLRRLGKAEEVVEKTRTQLSLPTLTQAEKDEKKRLEDDAQKELEDKLIEEKRLEGIENTRDQTERSAFLIKAFNSGLNRLRLKEINILDNIDETKIDKIEKSAIDTLRYIFEQPNDELAMHKYTVKVNKYDRIDFDLETLTKEGLEITEDNISRFYANIYELIYDTWTILRDKYGLFNIDKELIDMFSAAKESLSKSTGNIGNFIKKRESKVQEKEKEKLTKQEEEKQKKAKEVEIENLFNNLKSEIYKIIADAKSRTNVKGYKNFQPIKAGMLDYFADIKSYRGVQAVKVDLEFALDSKGKQVKDFDGNPVVDKLVLRKSGPISHDNNKIFDQLNQCLDDIETEMKTIGNKPARVISLIHEIKKIITKFHESYNKLNNPKGSGSGISKYRYYSGGAKTGEGDQSTAPTTTPATRATRQQPTSLVANPTPRAQPKPLPFVRRTPQPSTPGSEEEESTSPIPDPSTPIADPSELAQFTMIPSPADTRPVIVNVPSDEGLRHNEPIDKFVESLHNLFYIKKINRFNKSVFTLII